MFQGLAGLEALNEDWRALFDRLDRPSYLHLWEWHRSYLDAGIFNPESVFYCAIYQAERLVAVLPLVRRVKWMLGLPLRLLDLPFHRLVPHADIVVDPQIQDGFELPGVLQVLRRELQEPWDAVRLGLTPDDSIVSTAVSAMQGRRGGGLLMTYARDSSSALEIAPYDKMLAGFSKSHRKSLRKARDRLAALDGVEVHRARTAGELAQAFPHFLSVEASGWKGEAGTAVRCDPKLHALFSGIVKHLGPTGRCRINLLMQGDRVLAGHLGVAAGERYYVFKSGYDEAYKQEAPGKMLRERVLQQLADEPGMRYLDMISDQAWHEDWRPVRRRVLMHYLCRMSPRGLLVWAAMRYRMRSNAGNSDLPQTVET